MSTNRISGVMSPKATKTFTNAGTGIDCRRPAGQGGSPGQPANRVRVAGGGTIVFSYADGTTDTITYPANGSDDLEFVTIGAASTATGITIYW